MTTESQINYRQRVEKLPPDEREKYLGGWRDYLSKLSRPAYVRTLTNVARSYGPDFAGMIIQPEQVEATPPPPPTEQVAREVPKAEVPWYQKPFAWAAEQPALKPAIRAWDKYTQSWITPMAMGLVQPIAPKLREQIAGRSPFKIPTEERRQIWDESKLPWLLKTGAEMAVDPLSYIGWGLPGKAVGLAERAGMTGLAKAIKPIATAEEAYIKAAALPIKGIGMGLKKIPAIWPVPNESWLKVLAGKSGVSLRKPFVEAPKSIARNLPIHTANTLLNLTEAGALPSINKPLSQILADIRLGVPDRALVATITNPKQQQIVQNLIKHKDKLGLDELIRFADKNEGMASSMLGQRLIKAMAPELGIASPTLLPSVLGSFEKYSNKLYSLWKRTVLMTPYYGVQNLVENTVRPIFAGVNPFTNLSDYAKLPSLGQMPMEIQQLVAAVSEDLGKPLPAGLSKFALTPELGGMTEAVIGGLTRGKLYIPTHGAAFLDRAAMVRTFFQSRQSIIKTLMETTSPQTAEFQAFIKKIYGDAVASGTVEPKLLEHLQEIALTSPDADLIHAFNKVQKNKWLTSATAITDREKGLPEVIRQRITKEIPSAWAKNSPTDIVKTFDHARQMLPEYIVEYQRLKLLQNLREFRDLAKFGIPAKYKPHLTKIINQYKYPRVSEAQARLAAATSLTKYEEALMDCHREAQREMMVLVEENIAAGLVSKNVSPELFGKWEGVKRGIDKLAFKAEDDFTKLTLDTADIIRFAKDPTKIKKAWDNIIMEIQSLTPDIADTMRLATPDNDLLWSYYRRVQEQRWFNVGQDKFRAAQEITGVSLDNIPKTLDASGKVITHEDFMQAGKDAINSWETRALQAWEDKVNKATAQDKLLDTLREQSIKAKEAISLQMRTIQNQANDMAMDAMYSTFGNYASRTNLDEFMQGLGVPFWFFPSRSIPFYTTQMIQHPRLGAEVINMQNSRNSSEQPSRMFGTIRIPGTDYYYNPIQSSMLWQLVNQGSFTPMATGGLEQGMEWMRNNLSVSLGPQWKIAATLVERVMAKQAGTTPVTGGPQPLIPQQRWLEAIGHKKLPVISPIATFLNEPFDMYLRAVYGDNVAEWSKREVEKTIVDMGYNPQTAPKEIIEAGWDRYYTRQLLSIPAGAVKEMTPTELSRFEAINQKAIELGLSKEQRTTLRSLGESPFTGLRNDQLEALYADIPAQKLWRYIRPAGLTAQSKPIWNDYIQYKLEREALLYGTDKANPIEGSRLYKEQQYDKALTSGSISPREWKSLYRRNYADYISQLERLKKDYPLAPQTEADWDAYRKMLGWSDPVRHPDDIKLDEYYTTMDSSQFEDELGMFQYDAYKQAEANFFNGLPQSTVDYIRSQKDKYKTPLRAAYSRDMVKVQPYYDLQNHMLAQYPPEIAALIQIANTSPDPAIQKAIMSSAPLATLAMRRIRLAKEQLRLRNPELDQILRYWSS